MFNSSIHFTFQLEFNDAKNFHISRLCFHRAVKTIVYFQAISVILT